MDHEPPPETPLPWPSLRHPARPLVWILRVAALCSAVSGVGAAYLTTPADLTGWRAPVWIAGLLVTVAAAVLAWTAPSRIPTRPATPLVARGSRSERRDVRRDLLRGRPLDAVARRLVAVEVASRAALPIGVSVLGVMAGPQAVRLASDRSGTPFLDAAFGVLLAVPAIGFLGFLACVPRWVRIRRAATAVGAMPHVEPVAGSPTITAG